MNCPRKLTQWKKPSIPFVALVDGLQNIDPESEVGQEIRSIFGALDGLCTR
jgi:hypothetical protein